MADNVDLPASGRKAATDSVTYSGDTAEVQLVRDVGVTGAEGAKTVIDLPVDATFGRGVDVKRVVPGTGATNLGKAEDAAHASGDTGVMDLGVRNDALAALTNADGDYTPKATVADGRQIILRHVDQVTLGATSAGLSTGGGAGYGAGDQVGTLFSLAGAARAANGGGSIVGVSLIDADDEIAAYDVVFFNSTVTLAADRSAFAISDTDSLKIVGIARMATADVLDIGNNRFGRYTGVAIPYNCSGGTTLYAALITQSAHGRFTTTTDLRLNVVVQRNG